MTDQPSPTPLNLIADGRRREMAVEHILFGTIRFLSHRHPELLDELEGSLSHLWDNLKVKSEMTKPSEKSHGNLSAAYVLKHNFFRAILTKRPACVAKRFGGQHENGA